MLIPKPKDTNTHIYFRQISCDTVLVTNATQYSFFNDEGANEDERATALSEQDMMEWLLEGPLSWEVKAIICEELGMPKDSLYFLAVKKPFIEHSGSKPGDIDLILCNKNDPRYTIAMECKKIKVRFEDTGRAHINKTGSLMKGIEQVNALHQLGFHKCFLFIIIVTDGRSLADQGQLFRYADAETMRDVYYFPGFHKLREGIGVILCLVTQPTGKSINKSVSVAVREHKPAKGNYQSADTIETIIAFLKEEEDKMRKTQRQQS